MHTSSGIGDEVLPMGAWRQAFRDRPSDVRLEELSLKSALAYRIVSVLRHRHLSQTEMGALLGIPQPKVSRLLSGRVDGFSVEKLIHFLLRLDRDIEIWIRKAPRKTRSPRISVRSERRIDVIAA